MSVGRSVHSYGGELLSWVGSAPVLNGVATFYLTDNDAVAGKPLFIDITAAFACVKLDAARPTDVPLASIKSISDDKSIINVNCVVGKVLLALGDTMQIVPDGTTVYLQVWGS